MFNKKSEPATAPANDRVDVQAHKSEPQKPEISIDMQALETDKAKLSNSVIDEWLTMTGDLESEGDILVKGKVRGNIRCKLLIVDEQASVEGGMIAEEIVVRGSTKGVSRSNRVIFEDTARVDSEIYHRSFAVEEGARIMGALHHSNEPMTEKVVERNSAPAANGSAKADKAAA